MFPLNKNSAKCKQAVGSNTLPLPAFLTMLIYCHSVCKLLAFVFRVFHRISHVLCFWMERGFLVALEISLWSWGWNSSVGWTDLQGHGMFSNIVKLFTRRQGAFNSWETREMWCLIWQDFTEWFTLCQFGYMKYEWWRLCNALTSKAHYSVFWFGIISNVNFRQHQSGKTYSRFFPTLHKS